MKITQKEIISFSAFVLSALIAFTPLWNSADNKVYDFSSRIKHAMHPVIQSEKILQVNFSQKYLDSVSYQVQQRQFIKDSTDLIKRFDFSAALYIPQFYENISAVNKSTIFAEASRKGFTFLLQPVDNDTAVFTGAINSRKEVVFLENNSLHPQLIGEKSSRIPECTYFEFPKDCVLLTSGSCAILAVDKDSDGITRKVPLLYKYHNGYLPSVTLYLAMKELNADPHSLSVYPGHSITFRSTSGKKFSIPVDSSGAMYVSFPLQETDSNVSAENIISKPYSYREKIIFFSESTVNSDNFTSTPFTRFYTKTGVCAQGLNTILTESFVRQYSLVLKLAVVAALALILQLALMQKKNIWFVLTFIFSFIALIIFEAVMFFAAGYVPWFCGISFAWIFTFLLALCVRSVKMLIPAEKQNQ